MDASWAFVASAAAMVAAATGVVAPYVWRGARAGGAGRARAALAVAALTLALPTLAFALYAELGDWRAVVGDRDAVSAQLLDPEGAVGDEAYAELEQHLKRRPDDARALVLKARLDMQAQRYAEAAAAFERALGGAAKTTRDPGLWVEYAEALGMAQGRTLVGEPTRLLQRALALDANHPQALELAGSAAWELRRFAEAAGHWKLLLEQLPPDGRRHAELAAAIQRAEQRARLSLPAAR